MVDARVYGGIDAGSGIGREALAATRQTTGLLRSARLRWS
jgi:hypothetical protein